MAESFCDCDDLRILILIVMDVGIYIFVPQTHFKVRTLSEEVKTLPRTWLFWYARKKVLDRWLCQTRLLKTRGWICYLSQKKKQGVGYILSRQCRLHFEDMLDLKYLVHVLPIFVVAQTEPLPLTYMDVVFERVFTRLYCYCWSTIEIYWAKGHRVFKQSESPLTKSMMDLALSQCN